MRLSEVLSKRPNNQYKQIEGFLQNKTGKWGQKVDINVGKIVLNYFCTNCDDLRTFCSQEKLSVIFINKNMISIDCALKCVNCNEIIPIWFLIESEEDITGQAPKIRILKKCEKMIKTARSEHVKYNEFSELLNKAEQSYEEGLGAGAMVYLRKVLEKITIESANAVNIEYDKYKNGNPKNFSDLLRRVDNKCSIIPREFSENGCKLFKELSNIVHGDCGENLGLEKFEPCYRLVIGILENIENKKENMEAIEKLKWNENGDDINE